MHGQRNAGLKFFSDGPCRFPVDCVETAHRNHQNIRPRQLPDLFFFRHASQISQMHNSQSFRFHQEQQRLSPLASLRLIMKAFQCGDTDTGRRGIYARPVHSGLQAFQRVCGVMVMMAMGDKDSSHIGIRNVRERLEKLCGGSLTLESIIGEGTTAVIRIPRGEKTK